MSTSNGPVLIIPSPQGVPANSGSMGASITSSPQILYLMSKCSFSFSWSGTSPVGTISIEGSNDFTLNNAGTPYNTGTWNVMTLDYQGSALTTIPLGGNTGKGPIDITATGVHAIRLKYTFTSGVGTLTAYFNAKAG